MRKSESYINNKQTPSEALAGLSVQMGGIDYPLFRITAT